MAETPPSDNLESQLDALMAEMAAEPSEPDAAPGDAVIDRAVETVLESRDPEDNAPEVAEASDGDAELDGGFESVADTIGPEATTAIAGQPKPNAAPPSLDPGTPDAEAAVDRANDLAAQLDAMLPASAEPDEAEAGNESGSEADLEGMFEAPDSLDTPDVAESEVADEQAAAEAPSPEQQAESQADRATDLAAQLDAMLQTPADEPDAVEPVAQAAATEAEPTESAPTEDAGAPEGDFVSETELIGQVDEQLEAQAQEQIEADTQEDFSGLADLLGVDAAELEAVPPSKTEEPASEATDEPEGEALDEFDGAFESVDGLLAENDVAPVATEPPGEFGEADDEFEDAVFASPDDLLDEGEEEESWYEPPEPEATETPDFSANQTPDDRAAVTTMRIDDRTADTTEAASEPAEPATAGEGASAPKPAAAGKAATPAEPWWTPHAARARAAGRYLRPYLAATPRATVWLTKAGCYYANAPLDLVAGRLGSEEKPAPPLKQYVGLVGAAVLIPGCLLLLFGLLG